MYKKIFVYIQSLFKNWKERVSNKKFEHRTLPPVQFNHVFFSEKKINNDQVCEGDFYCQTHNQKNKWVMFRCPCTCGALITLSLQPVHSPHWVLSFTADKRPKLHPSIWRDIDCCSHFWLKDGRVYWCNNTGAPPSDSHSG